MTRIASLYRTADDTIRARIFDRADIGSEGPRGREFDVDVFRRSPANVTTASEGMGDVFYSRAEALAFVLVVMPDARPMLLPRSASSWTHGWPL